jgi:hypothetical protein
VKLFFGYKDKSNQIINIRNINIVDFIGLNNNNNNFNFEFSVGGYIHYGKEQSNSEYFSNIINSFQSNLISLFMRMKETKQIINRLCIFNPLFNSIPVYCYKAIYLNDQKTHILDKNSIFGTLQKKFYLSYCKFN